jgi:hypothetical protein
VVEAVRNHHYSKSVVSAGEAVLKPVEGMRLDIVPQKNPLDLKAGEALPVRVLFDGKPLAGAQIEADHEKVAVTDKDGTARVPLGKGRQLLTVERREPLRNDPDADFVSVTTTLTFEVAK